MRELVGAYLKDFDLGYKELIEKSTHINL